MAIIMAVAAILLFIDLFFIVKPLIGKVAKVMPEVSAKASRARIMDVDVKNISAYKKNIINLKKSLSSFKTRFSTKEEISPLLRSLSDTAKLCNVKIVSINPVIQKTKSQQGRAPGAYKQFPIFLSAVSGYHSMGLFFSKLENLGTFMRVTDLNIVGDPTRKGSHKFNIVLVTYILGGQEEAR